MNILSAVSPLRETKHAVLRALWYFEIFQHPLTAAELYAYSNCPGMAQEDFAEILETLLREGAVFQFGAWYQSQNNPA